MDLAPRHPERSEGSHTHDLDRGSEMLRCAQHDCDKVASD